MILKQQYCVQVNEIQRLIPPIDHNYDLFVCVCFRYISQDTTDAANTSQKTSKTLLVQNTEKKTPVSHEAPDQL